MHKQFNKDSRLELAALLRMGLSKRLCAKGLGFDHSAVIRELDRNIDDDGVYRGASAHRKYLERRKKSKQKQKKIENDLRLRQHIKKRLKKRDSPEQISGRINNIEKEKYQSVSYPTIYAWIYTGLTLIVPGNKQAMRTLTDWCVISFQKALILLT